MTKIEALELELKARKMVAGTGLDWGALIRHKPSKHNLGNKLDAYYVEYVELALGIIEGKPVWVESILFDKYGVPQCAKHISVDYLSHWSWNPPKPKNEKADKLCELLTIQKRACDCVNDPYFRGMYNGMEVMLACVEDRSAEFINKPEEEIDANASRYLWLRNNRKLNDWWSVCGPKDMYENIDADIDAAMLESAKESLPINPEEVYSPHTKVIE